MIRDQIEKATAKFLDTDYGPASFAEFAGNRLGIDFDSREFRGSFEDARKEALEKATSAAPTHIQEMIEESLNQDEDPKDWKWSELTRAMNAKYGLKLAEKDLRKIPFEQITEYLVAKAEGAVKGVDLSDGQRYLTKSYGAEALSDWMRQKFGVKVTIEEIAAKSGDDLNEYLNRKVREAISPEGHRVPRPRGNAELHVR